MTLATLNNGWPMSDGPMWCLFRFERRTGTCPTSCGCGSSRCHEYHRPWWQDQAHNPLSCVASVRRGQLYMVCQHCPQAIMVLTEPSDVAADPDRPAAAAVDLMTLRARVADHWLKCHGDLIAEEIRT